MPPPSFVASLPISFRAHVTAKRPRASTVRESQHCCARAHHDVAEEKDNGSAALGLTSILVGAATAAGVFFVPISISDRAALRPRQQTAVRLCTAAACGSLVGRSVHRVVRTRRGERTNIESDGSAENAIHDQNQNRDQLQTSVVHDFLLDDEEGQNDKTGTVFAGSRNEWTNEENRTSEETTMDDNNDDFHSIPDRKNGGLRLERIDQDTESRAAQMTDSGADADNSTPPVQQQQPSGTYSYSFKKPNRKKKAAQQSTEATADESSSGVGDVGSFSFSHMRAEFLSDSAPNSNNSSSPSSSAPPAAPKSASSSESDVEQDWFKSNPIDTSTTTSTTASTSFSFSSSMSANTADDMPTRISQPSVRARRRRAGTGPMSSGEVARRLLTIPIFFVRDVLAPAADVISVAWHDLKVTVEDIMDCKYGKFLLTQDDIEGDPSTAADEDVRWERDMMAFRDDWQWVKRQKRDNDANEDETGATSNVPDESQLTEEERQILRVQNVARSVKDGLLAQLGKLINDRKA